jgi:AcrR family transcriptional regulator
MERVLNAAAELVADDAFHTATMDDLARRAGVARATVFSRFGSKLGVLEALSLRCARGPEMRALREAQGIEDPVAALDALLLAGCNLWEKEGYIMIQLKAIVVLEPDASAIIDAQYDDQHRGMEALARKLHKTGGLRKGCSVARATATLHALTSVETFTLLRRDHGLPLTTVKQTIVELSRTILSQQVRPGSPLVDTAVRQSATRWGVSGVTTELSLSPTDWD